MGTKIFQYIWKISTTEGKKNTQLLKTSFAHIVEERVEN